MILTLELEDVKIKMVVKAKFWGTHPVTIE